MSIYKFDKSEEIFQARLDLFKPLPVDTSVFKSEYVTYRPVSQITKGSPITFTIPPTSSAYKDLKRTLLHVKCRILKDGKPVTAENKVALANLSLHSIFRQVDVSFQQNVITTSVGLNYGYKSILDSILYYTEEPKESHMGSAMYFRDDAEGINDPNPDLGKNLGLAQRWEYTKNGQVVDMEGSMFVDIFQQNKLLVNGVQVDVKLFPSMDKFALISGEEDAIYTVEIVESALKVCQVTVNPALILAHAQLFKTQKAVYNYSRSEIRTFNIAPGSQVFSTDDIFSGKIPSRLIVGIVDAEGYSGSYKKNPYAFEHHDCNFMGFYVDGHATPHEEFSMDYKNNLYITPYLSLFTGIDRHNNVFGNEISREEYKSGYCLYIFNVDGRKDQEFVKLTKRGHTRLSIRLATPSARTLTVVVYAQHPAVLEVDESRNILL